MNPHNAGTKKQQQVGEGSFPSQKCSEYTLVFLEIIENKLQNKCNAMNQQTTNFLRMELFIFF